MSRYCWLRKQLSFKPLHFFCFAHLWIKNINVRKFTDVYFTTVLIGFVYNLKYTLTSFSSLEFGSKYVAFFLGDMMRSLFFSGEALERRTLDWFESYSCVKLRLFKYALICRYKAESLCACMCANSLWAGLIVSVQQSRLICQNLGTGLAKGFLFAEEKLRLKSWKIYMTANELRSTAV